MKTKVINFISQFNQVAFFLGVIAFILFLLAALIKDLISTNTYKPGVEVIASKTSEKKPSRIKYEKSYLTTIKDIHITQVTSEKIYLDDEFDSGISNLYSSRYLDYNVVNLVFSSESGSKLKLFKKDTLISDIKTAKFDNADHSPLLFKNVYSIVSKDTNKDGYLNHKDQTDLYVSNYDGTDLIKIFENIENLHLFKSNQLMITRKEAKSSEVYIYNVESGEKIKLDTSLD